MREIETINVEVKITKRQMRALGWKLGRKIASRDDVREFVNSLLQGDQMKDIETRYLSYRKHLKEMQLA
jgi:hypothetical protein